MYMCHVCILPHTPLPSRLPCNTEQSSTRCPCWYSMSLLVIHLKYSSVYMSIPNSLTIPSPYPSPLVTISLFSKSVSLLKPVLFSPFIVQGLPGLVIISTAWLLWDAFENLPKWISDFHTAYILIQNIPNMFSMLGKKSFTVSACSSSSVKSFSHVRIREPLDCSPPASFVHGILQTRILEWVAIPFTRGSLPRNQTWLSCIAGRFFTTAAPNSSTRQKEIFSL